jgi:CRISPR system Cascade subunit CasD
MADPILLLRLWGPLQSWGVRSRWDVRDTGLDPSKSGVVGLLGCALGIERGHPELEALDRKLIFGVRADRPGVVSTDYHTVTGYHRTAAGEFKHGESTIVSPRDYLHDAAFLVALASRERGLLERLKESLERPRWPVYLGRKSCVPVRPVLERLTTEYGDLKSALC